MLPQAAENDHILERNDLYDREKWERLRKIIEERSFSQGTSKKLSSGRSSNFYFNMKMTMSQPEALNLIAELMLPIIEKAAINFIGGMEMGAVPIVDAIATVSYRLGMPIPLIWIRKEAKKYGTMALLEGEDASKLKNKRAIMVDDVTTTGGSVLKAIELAEECGLEISQVITIVDRLEGAKENLAEKGIELVSLYNAKHFCSD